MECLFRHIVIGKGRLFKNCKNNKHSYYFRVFDDNKQTIHIKTCFLAILISSNDSWKCVYFLLTTKISSVSVTYRPVGAIFNFGGLKLHVKFLKLFAKKILAFGASTIALCVTFRQYNLTWLLSTICQKCNMKSLTCQISHHGWGKFEIFYH